MLSSQLIYQLAFAHKCGMYDAICQFTPAREVQQKELRDRGEIDYCQPTPTREVQLAVNMTSLMRILCQLTPTREVQPEPLSMGRFCSYCQLTPTREVQRQSCVPLRGLHVYQLHFLHAKACRLYGLFSTGLSFLQNCRKPCREFPYSTSCVGLRALPRLTALQSAENSGAKVLWFL